MHLDTELRRELLVLISLVMILIVGAPLNKVNARQRSVRYHRKVLIRHHYISPYPTVNNRIKRVDEQLNWTKRPKYRKETIRSTYGPHVTFKTLFFISSKVAGRNYLVQSLNVTPDDRYMYVGYDHSPQINHDRNLTKVVKINMRNFHFKVSRAFNGGHGQALAYNPAKHSLWLLNDPGGPINKGQMERININSLRPQHRVDFRLRGDNDLGDSLAFDNRNHIYNENLIWRKTAKDRFRPGMIILYRGFLNNNHIKLNIVLQGLRHSPGNVIQGIAYNPVTKRLYIESNDVIISIPVDKLGHLRSSDVKETILRQHREYEGITFDRRGYAYILMNHPKEVMKSTHVF